MASLTGTGGPRQANFAYLLAGLLFVLIAAPVINEFTTARSPLLTPLIFTATMLIGVWSLLESRRQFWIGMALAAVALGGTGVRYTEDQPLLGLIALAATFGFCVMSAVFATRNMFAGGIDRNRLTGALCVYLLLGIALGVLNMMVALLLPGSFGGLPARAADIAGLDLIYYSFVTMSTLGYGDITPARPIAKGLAYLTAVAGQFYIAMLVGSLVSMYLADRQAGRD